MNYVNHNKFRIQKVNILSPFFYKFLMIFFFIYIKISETLPAILSRKSRKTAKESLRKISESF